MPVLQVTGIVYGALLIVGGFIGLKAGSRVSLVMGILSGLLALGSGLVAGSDPARAALTLAVVGGALSLSFFSRLRKTGKFMPSGMLLGLSLIVFVIALSKILIK